MNKPEVKIRKGKSWHSFRNTETRAKSNSRYIMSLSWIISPNILLHFTHHHIALWWNITSVCWQQTMIHAAFMSKKSQCSLPVCLFQHSIVTVLQSN